MSSGKDQTIYAAAEGREFLRGALAEKPNEWINEFAGLIDDPETLDLLNYYCSLWADRGLNFLDTRLAEIIVRNASTRMYDRAFREGNISQLKGSVGLTNQQQDNGHEAVMEAASRLADEGAIYLVLGSPGSGKTSFALDVLRAWGAVTGGRIQANIEWDGADEFVADSATMLDGMAGTAGQVVQFIDEGGQTLTSRGAEQQTTDQFAKTLKLIRKKLDGDEYAKRGSVLIVGHTEMETAAEIRRLASGAFVKPNRADPGHVVFKESEGGKDTLEQVAEFHGVSDTRESYDEHEAAKFHVVIEDQDNEDDGPDPEDVRREEAIRTALTAVLVRGDSYPDAAQLVPYADTWVGERVREWKRGDHRDVLAEDAVPESEDSG